MDYHVFLLSRIRERFDQTRDKHRVRSVRAADDRKYYYGRGADHGGRYSAVRDG